MKIAFCAQHSYYGGLSNNGGSRTILLCCEELRKQGHRADVVTHSDKFTWFKHREPLKRIPDDTDVCIACSVSDIEPMLASKPRNAKVFWYCRGIERWQMPKEKIIKRAGMIRTLVNSENMQVWFKAHGVDTTVAYQGVDTEKWADLNAHEPKTIGFLLSRKKIKNFQFINNLIKPLGDSHKYVGYSSRQDASREILSVAHKWFKEYYVSPSHTELVSIYNRAKYWVSVSTNEGLHNPPLEAGLCGCILICSDAKLGGTADVCKHGETGYVYKRDNVLDCIENICGAEEKVIAPCKQLIYAKIENRKQAMQKLLNIISTH